jgi:hypothetical protein
VLAAMFFLIVWLFLAVGIASGVVLIRLKRLKRRD